jgi:hypothetical protein
MKNKKYWWMSLIQEIVYIIKLRIKMRNNYNYKTGCYDLNVVEVDVLNT